MTTTVKVTAHCAADKEVVVTTEDTIAPHQTIVLQDGESKEVYAYDARTIVIKEVMKDQS